MGATWVTSGEINSDCVAHLTLEHIVNEFNERDLFAALAMCGIRTNLLSNGWSDEQLAKEAYDLANAMMAEKEKRDAGISAY
jgi:hypothetical protein